MQLPDFGDAVFRSSIVDEFEDHMGSVSGCEPQGARWWYGHEDEISIFLKPNSCPAAAHEPPTTPQLIRYSVPGPQRKLFHTPNGSQILSRSDLATASSSPNTEQRYL